MSLLSKTSPYVSCKLLARARSIRPAASSGFLVVPRITILSICTWHIWNGMPEKAVRRPPNPSPVTEAMSYPSVSRCLLPSWYKLVDSLSPNCHQRFSFHHGSRMTETHQLEFSVRCPNHRVSATMFTRRGRCSFFGASYLSNRDRIVLLSKWYSSLSSRRVCFSKTYFFQSSFSKCVFFLSLLLKILPQTLHQYFCLPSWIPLLTTFSEWQSGQYLPFF